MFINKDINTFSFINNWQLVAQAELVAANEERIQSSRSSSSSSGPSSGSAAAHQQITSSLLSSALASAGIPRASTSRSHSEPFILLYYKIYFTLIIKTRAQSRGDKLYIHSWSDSSQPIKLISGHQVLDTLSKFGFIKINMMKENTVQDNADDCLWTGVAAPITCFFFQNKV